MRREYTSLTSLETRRKTRRICALPAMVDEDPQEWELDQLEKLENAANTYGWKHSSHQYKARLKLIQAQTLQRMQRALGDAPAPVRGQGRKPSRLLPTSAQVSESKRPPVGKWCSKPGQKWMRFKSWSSAKALLGEPPHSNWMTDREAPGSKLWRRYISIDKESGEFERCRIIQQKGE